jgi:hypothetical protein
MKRSRLFIASAILVACGQTPRAGPTQIDAEGVPRRDASTDEASASVESGDTGADGGSDGEASHQVDGGADIGSESSLLLDATAEGCSPACGPNENCVGQQCLAVTPAAAECLPADEPADSQPPCECDFDLACVTTDAHDNTVCTGTDITCGMAHAVDAMPCNGAWCGPGCTCTDPTRWLCTCGAPTDAGQTPLDARVQDATEDGR